MLQGLSSRLLAPLFGDVNSKIAMEAFQRNNSHRHSIQIRSFSEAPKEIPNRSLPVASSLGYSVHEFQLEPALVEMSRYSPCFESRSTPEIEPNFFSSINFGGSPPNSSDVQLRETPRSVRRQAYVALKASPNVSANGDALLFSSAFLKFTHVLLAGIGMCL